MGTSVPLGFLYGPESVVFIFNDRVEFFEYSKAGLKTVQSLLKDVNDPKVSKQREIDRVESVTEVWEELIGAFNQVGSSRSSDPEHVRLMEISREIREEFGVVSPARGFEISRPQEKGIYSLTSSNVVFYPRYSIEEFLAVKEIAGLAEPVFGRGIAGIQKTSSHIAIPEGEASELRKVVSKYMQEMHMRANSHIQPGLPSISVGFTGEPGQMEIIIDYSSHDLWLGCRAPKMLFSLTAGAIGSYLERNMKDPDRKELASMMKEAPQPANAGLGEYLGVHFEPSVNPFAPTGAEQFYLSRLFMAYVRPFLDGAPSSLTPREDAFVKKALLYFKRPAIPQGSSDSVRPGNLLN